MRGVAVVVVILVLGLAACAGASRRSGATGSTDTTDSTGSSPSSKTGGTAGGRVVNASLQTPDGRTRTYHLFVPAGVPADPQATPPVPLVVGLHGGLGSGTQFERSSGFDAYAARDRVLIVYPDGIGQGSRGSAVRTWNAGGCCGPAMKAGVDDVGFVRLLVSALKSQYPIDPTRVVAVGHSNGGMLAYRLACQAADVFSAIGLQSSALVYTLCTPSQPVSVLHIHGSADQNVPIGGGRGPRALSQVNYPPAVNGVHLMAAADGCPPEPSVAKEAYNADVTVSTWSPCRAGSEVQFVVVKGASHAWMGPNQTRGVSGVSYRKYDSSAQIWQFVMAHGRTPGA